VIYSGPSSPLTPLSCSSAYDTAARYNLQGPSQQSFFGDLWVCESANAAQRGSTGLLFTCSGEGEFSVFQA